MTHADRIMPPLLLLISAVLAGWGVLGLVEYASPDLALGLQNSNFPPGTQFLHFLAIFATGTVFLVGYRLRWRPTPFATVTMYAVLATLCFVETVDFQAFGEGPGRFIAIGVEYTVYMALGAYLLRSETLRRHFSASPEAKA